MTVHHRRLIQLSAFLAAWLIVVVCRLAQVQLARHDEYVARALRQQERIINVNPIRGSIADAQGRLLAESVAAESIYADLQYVSDVKRTAMALASVRALGLTPTEAERRLRVNGEIARQIPPPAAAEVRRLKLPGIYSLSEFRRVYPKGSLGANLIGFVSTDGQGLAGVEHSFDEHVRGRSARVTVLRDARHGRYLVGGPKADAAVEGSSVQLTIDSVIQFFAERALRRAIDRYSAAGGCAIVMDPNDGRILAMASDPSFDPNRPRDSAQSAWRNRCVQDLYEPGSTFKIVTASAGLEEREVTPSQMIDCGMGQLEVAHTTFHEHGGNRYGVMTFEDVVVHSSNVGTMKVGLSLGPRRFYGYISRFGFGRRTGVELPGEAAGILRPTSQWSLLSSAVISIGQEIGVTPLQLLVAASTVANGGRRVQPHVVDRVINAAGETVLRAPVPAPERVISDRTAAVMNEILKAVVSRGTGQNAALTDHVVAGKTGTAQKAARGGYSPDKFVASFVGYVPADRPRLAILVVVDEPRGAQYGGTIAAPAFREIAEASLRYLRVPPSIPGRELVIEPPRLAIFSHPPATKAPRSIAPDLRGLDVRRAVARAVEAGLKVEVEGDGLVAAQTPPPGLPASGRDVPVRLSLSPVEKAQ
jgi:cell division protein FtsI (penicillin-binding protein 3)